MFLDVDNNEELKHVFQIALIFKPVFQAFFLQNNF